MSNHKQNSIQNNQQGLVAILVTMLLMIVLTLIVLSFAAISRREQRNALDRQLSTQAFYAAESGVSDAKKVIESWVNTNAANLSTNYMDTCTHFAQDAKAGGFAPFSTSAQPNVLPLTLTGSGAATYTCLFVDPSPQTIEYSKSDEAHVLPIKAKNGNPIKDIEIYWDDGSGTNNFGSCPTPGSPPGNPPSITAGSCDAPVLRVELVKDNALTASSEFFIYPGLPGGPVTLPGGSPSGKAVTGDCASGGPKKCLITIDGLNGSYYMRIKGIYKPAALTITAHDAASQVELVGAQVVIDATGKATDVERRIQVRVKANNFSGPLYLLEGTDKICKKFTIDGTTATDAGGCWAGGTPD